MPLTWTLTTTMTDRNEVADLLDSAADIIERDGWCQRDIEQSDGAVSTIGALRKAKLVHAAKRDTHLQALVALDTRVGHIAKWNDAIERTKQEAIDELRQAAERQRGG